MSQADNSTHPRVLIIGGYGVFGSRLSRRLAKHADVDVIVAGRSLAAAKVHCDAFGGMPASIDTGGDLAEALAEWQPTVVVDAAGPYQLYGDDPYRVARAALAAGAHYIDLADDGTFVAGIGELDRAATEAGRVALSGCSSVPAVSAAAVRALSAGLTSIESISSSILPGNRAPRGPSVVRAILAQVGKAIRVRKGVSGRPLRAGAQCNAHLYKFRIAKPPSSAMPARSARLICRSFHHIMARARSASPPVWN